MERYRVGVDIGGTFTDIVFLESGGRVYTRKVSSSVEDYAQAIARGLEQVFEETALAGPDVAEVRHGTTVASNAIIENKGALTGLVTTRGFRDVLELRNLRMPRLYDLSPGRSRPSWSNAIFGQRSTSGSTRAVKWSAPSPARMPKRRWTGWSPKGSRRSRYASSIRSRTRFTSGS